MNILETENLHELDMGTFYVKESNIKIWIGANQVRITDLTNALKRGKECLDVSISFWGKNHSDFINSFIKIGTYANVHKLFTSVVKDEEFEFQTKVAYEDFEVYVTKNKSNRKFSPFALSNLKPLKEEPKKWTMAHVHKALANGQFENLKCDGRYTDDYAYDAAYNFGMGKVEAPMDLLKDLIESPSGWWVYQNDRGEIDFNCHSFLGYSFKFIVEPELELA